MHYEVLLRMPQWAGHHPQAMAGLADAHYRLDQFDESLKWLDVIRESDAPFYEDRKLKAFRDVAADTRQASRDGRLARARLDRTIAFDQAAFTGEPPVLLLGTPACSTNALTFGRLTTPHPSFTMTFDVPQLISESAYWIEFWFRNETTDSHATPIPQIEIRWAGSSTPSQSVAVIRTFGLDFMGAARLQAPMASQGAITLTFVNWQGVQQIHGLRLRPVTARREEALLNFWEGRDTP